MTQYLLHINRTTYKIAQACIHTQKHMNNAWSEMISHSHCFAFWIASTMHSWLLHMIDVDPSYTYLTSAKSSRSQIASFMQWLVAMHFGSIVDNTMVGCFLYFHEMTPTPTKNTYPMVDRRSFASPAQCILQKHLKTISLPLRHNLKSKVPFRYLMMRFTAI